MASLLVLVGLPAVGAVVSALKGHWLLSSIGALLSVTMFVLWIPFSFGTASRLAPVVTLLVWIVLLAAWAPVVGVVRMARPGSWWWRNRYSYSEQIEAISRY